MTDAMIERVAASLSDYDREMSWAFARQQARAALDAAMPVADTVEALDALPTNTKVLGCDGTVWVADGGYRWTDTDGRGWPTVDVINECGPLRVIWTPEVTP